MLVLLGEIVWRQVQNFAGLAISNRVRALWTHKSTYVVAYIVLSPSVRTMNQIGNPLPATCHVSANLTPLRSYSSRFPLIRVLQVCLDIGAIANLALVWAQHAHVADRFAREIRAILECDPMRSRRLMRNPFSASSGRLGAITSHGMRFSPRVRSPTPSTES
jgi:hypothetical protein